MPEGTAVAVQPTKPKDLTPIKINGTQDIFERMDRLYEAIARRAFDIFEHNGRGFGHDLEDWFKAESELLVPVKVELKETENVITIAAGVPGFSEKELEVTVEPTRVIITGKRETNEKKEEKGKVVYEESTANEVMRVIGLPKEVETNKATATLKDGVLQLELAKVAEAKTKVDVKAA